MKIKVTDAVLDYEGKPMKSGDKDITWRTVFFEALNTMLPNEVQTAEDKNKCYQITTKCYQGNEIELTIDDRHFLLEKIRKIYNPLFCGRAQELLDSAEPANSAPQAN